MPTAYDNYKASPNYNGGAGMTSAQLFAARQAGDGSAYMMPAPTSSGSGGSSGGGSGTNSTSTTNKSSDVTTTGKQTDTQTTNTSVKNMTDESLAALDKLIAQLERGGTDNMLADRAIRLKAIADSQRQQADYSKDAAFNDARGAMDAETARALNQIMPALTRSAEGAGTSKNSLRALMTQNAATNAAQGAATIGLNAAGAYGNVSNGISAILAQLVAMKDPAADALLAALNISKGAVQNTNSVVTNVKDLWTNVKGNETSVTNTNTTTPQQAIGLTPSFASGSGFQVQAPPKLGSVAAPVSNNNMMYSSGPLQKDYSSFATPMNGFGMTGGYADQLMRGY